MPNYSPFLKSYELLHFVLFQVRRSICRCKLTRNHHHPNPLQTLVLRQQMQRLSLKMEDFFFFFGAHRKIPVDLEQQRLGYMTKDCLMHFRILTVSYQFHLTFPVKSPFLKQNRRKEAKKKREVTKIILTRKGRSASFFFLYFSIYLLLSL